MKKNQMKILAFHQFRDDNLYVIGCPCERLYDQLLEIGIEHHFCCPACCSCTWDRIEEELEEEEDVI